MSTSKKKSFEELHKEALGGVKSNVSQKSIKDLKNEAHAENKLAKLPKLLDSWSKSATELSDSYTSRFLDENGKYVPKYREDSENAYAGYKTAYGRANADYHIIMSVLDRYGKYLHPESLAKIETTLNDGRNILSAMEGAYKQDRDIVTKYPTAEEYDAAIKQYEDYVAKSGLNLDEYYYDEVKTAESWVHFVQERLGPPQSKFKYESLNPFAVPPPNSTPGAPGDNNRNVNNGGYFYVNGQKVPITNPSSGPQYITVGGRRYVVPETHGVPDPENVKHITIGNQFLVAEGAIDYKKSDPEAGIYNINGITYRLAFGSTPYGTSVLKPINSNEEMIIDPNDRRLDLQMSYQPSNGFNLREINITPDEFSREYTQEDYQAKVSDYESKLAYYEDAKKIQKHLELSNVGNPESPEYDLLFDSYVQKGKDVGTPKISDIDDFTSGDKNYVALMRYNNYAMMDMETKITTGMADSDDPRYLLAKYGTEEQVNIYSYYYGTGEKHKAAEYLEGIEGELRAKHANVIADRMDTDFEKLVFSAYAGWDKFKEDVGNFFNFGDDYIIPSSVQMASGLVRQKVSDENGWLMNTAYDTIGTITYMVPSMAASFAANAIVPGSGAAIGNAMFATGSAGGAYTDALNKGYSKAQARTYSALVAASEVGLSYLFSGISAYGGKASGNVIRKAAAGVDNAFTQFVIKFGGSMLSEGFEEGLQEILTPFFQNLALNAGNDWSDIDWGNVAYSSLLGALTAGILEGPRTARETRRFTKTGETIIRDGQVENLAKLGKSLLPDTDAYELAGMVDENTGAYTIGRLFYEIGANGLTQTNVADITAALEKKYIAPNDAKTIAKWIDKVVRGEHLTREQQMALNMDSDIGKIVWDILTNENSTIRQRVRAYRNITTFTDRNSKNNDYDKRPAQQPGEAKTQNVTQSKFETSDNGETINNKTGEGVEIVGVASIKDGELTLKVKNIEGKTENINAKDLSLSQNDALIYSAIVDMDVSPASAWNIAKNFKASDGVSAEVYAADAPIAYRYGVLNYREGLSKLDLTTDQAMTAFYQGRNDSDAKLKTEAKKDAIAKKDSKKKTEAKKKSSEEKATRIKGKVIFEGFEYDESSANDLQKASMAGIKLITEMSSLEVHVYKSFKENGKLYTYVDGKKRLAPNGYFKEGTNKIYIDLNAGQNGEGLMLDTAGHEIGHYMADNAWEYFKEYADFLFEHYGEDVPVDDLINRQKQRIIEGHKMDGKAIPSEDKLFKMAYVEVVCDASTKMLADENAYLKLAEARKQNPSWWKAFGEAIKHFLNKLKSVIGMYSNQTTTNEAMYVEQFSKDVFDKLQDLYLKAFVKADENFNAIGAKKTSTETNTVASAEEGNMYSKRTTQQFWHTGMTNAEVSRLERIAKRELDTTDNYIDNGNKWLYNKTGENTYFALYSTEDTSNPTILYACKGNRAELEHQILINYFAKEVDNNGSIHTKSGIIDRILMVSESTASAGNAHSRNTVGRRSNNGNVGVHSKNSRNRPSEAFLDCLRNIAEIQERNGRSGLNLFSDRDSDTYSRIQEMQTEVNRLSRSIEEIESNKDFKKQLNDIFSSDDIEENIKKYQQLLEESEYGKLKTKRDALKLELENLRKSFEEEIANNNLKEEKEAIAKSGLSEAEYFRKQAVKEFGYTPYFYDAGYITPNGKMLNFSGEKGKHFGSRGQDHRAIGIIYANVDGSQAMVKFMNEGNVRLMAESPGIDVSTQAEPTTEQYRTIRNFVYEYAKEGYFNVDISDENGRVVGSLEYENNINPTRVINDIKHYYSTGEIRQQSNVDKFRYQDRDSDSVSNRSLLANSLESAAQNDIERNKLAQYKEKISLIEAEEQKLSEIQKQLFTKDAVDPAKRKELQFEAKQISNRINTYDRQLLNLEATTALKNVLNREKALAMKKQKQKDAETLKAYKEKVAKTQRELLDKWQTSRKNAVEGRNKTAVRHKIKNVVADLNRLLNRGTRERNVKIGLRDAVSKALDTAEILFSTEITNADIVRLGVESVTDAEQKALEKYADLLDALANTNDEAAEKRIRGQISVLNSKLKELFIRERARLNRESVSNALDSLANAYAELKDSKDDYIKNNAYVAGMHERIKNLSKDLQGVTIRDMSLSQLESVYEIYSMVKHMVTQANGIFRNGKYEDLSRNISNVQSELDNIASSTKDNAEALEKVADFFRGFTWNELKPYAAFERLGSKTFEKLYWDVVEADGVWARDTQEAADFIEAARKKHGYKKWDMQKAKTFKSANGLEFKLTLGDMMSIYAYSKRPQAEKHMTEGGFVFDKYNTYKENGITHKHKKRSETYRVDLNLISQIIRELGKMRGVTQYVDEVQSYLTKLGEKGNEVSRIMFGIDLFKEKVYFPLQSDADYRSSIEQALNATQTMASLKNIGMSKETVPNASNPIVLKAFDDVVLDHINQMAKYHAYVVPIENLSKVFNNVSMGSGEYVSTQALIASKFGESAKNYFDQFITDLNGGTLSSGAKNPLMSLFTTAKGVTVSANLSVVVQQYFAIVRAMDEINPKYFTPFLNGSASKASEKQYEQMKKYVPLAIIKEIGGFDMGANRSAQKYIGDAETRLTGKKVKESIKDAAMWLPSKMDEIGWSAIWRAVKKEIADTTNLKAGTEEFYQACGKRATEVIAKTQVYDSVTSRSGYMRSKRDSVKYLTSYMGEPTTIVSMMFRRQLDFVRAIKSKDKQKIASATKKLARTSAVLILATVLIDLAKSLPYAMRDDDDEESLLERWAKYFGDSLASDMNPLTLLPGGRDFVSLWEGWDVERPDLSLISDFFKSFKKAFDGETTWEEVMNLAGATANLFGYPLKNVIRDTKGIVNLFGDLFDDVQPEDIGEAFAEGFTGEELSVTERFEKYHENGDSEKCDKLIEDMIDKKKKSGKTEKEAKSALRSTFTSKYKSDYVTAAKNKDYNEMNRIRRMLYATGLYGSLNDLDETLKKWRTEK